MKLSPLPYSPIIQFELLEPSEIECYQHIKSELDKGAFVELNENTGYLFLYIQNILLDLLNNKTSLEITYTLLKNIIELYPFNRVNYVIHLLVNEYLGDLYWGTQNYKQAKIYYNNSFYLVKGWWGKYYHLIRIINIRYHLKENPTFFEMLFLAQKLSYKLRKIVEQDGFSKLENQFFTKFSSMNNCSYLETIIKESKIDYSLSNDKKYFDDRFWAFVGFHKARELREKIFTIKNGDIFFDKLDFFPIAIEQLINYIKTKEMENMIKHK